jgi:ADP-heptose:LPS heptosyltransferase
VTNIIINTDCKYFRGHIPCAQHKLTGIHCAECKEYLSQTKNILIVKLGAIGDVIRTTPLLTALKKKQPKARIFWLTYYPEVLPSLVDVPLKFTVQDIVYLQAIEFDLVINLDKDREACAIASVVHSKHKCGFVLKGGKPSPVSKKASHKFLTGLFDDINKANKKNYLEEIFEICGYKYRREEYVLDLQPQDTSSNWNIDHSKTVIGLNTGCGERWTSRLWDIGKWIELAKSLKKDGKEVIILGGSSEHEKNIVIAKKSGTKYFGHYPIQIFFHLVNECDVVVTTVTMVLHVVIGLKKKVVLLNNIFNKNEFELYGRGVVIEPSEECKCFFSPKCTNTKYFCMDHLFPSAIMNGIKTILLIGQEADGRLINK